MAGRDWLVTEDGHCEAHQISASLSNRELLAEPYRLYRFLTDLEDILKHIKDDRRRLEAIRPLVRRLLMSSYWLQTKYLPPPTDPGWSVLTLYNEPYFPFTVQISAWLPDKFSQVHNHATWGVVALISGSEKNIFWRRSSLNGQQPSSDLKSKNQVVQVGKRILVSGDVISFMPEVIHSIETIGDKPTITFNVYGKMNGKVTYFNGSED